MATLLQAAAWVGYRRGRDCYYRFTGRNPLPNVPGFAAEWRAIRGLQKARCDPPVKQVMDADGNTLWDTPLCPMWSPPGMTAHFMAMISAEMLGGVYDLANGTSERVVVDAGANIGFFSRFVLSRGAARVIAFEPSPSTAVCLRRNLRQWIDSGKVTVIEKALWHQDGILRFSTENVANPGAHHISDMGGIEIQATSLDNCLAALNVSRIDYLKMDIEGAEQSALQGAESIIRGSRPVCSIAVEHTADMMQNAIKVVEIMRRINSDYQYVVTERHPYQSPSAGPVLCPYTLKFY